MDMEQVRANIKRERLVRGWSKKEVAAKAGYATEGMIHQIEQGTRRPSAQHLLALAKAFEMSVSDLVGDKVPYSVTNHANGAHAIGYQHNERSVLMTDEFQVMLRKVVEEVVDARCEKLVQEVKVAMREVVRETTDAEGEP
jgi:transcriptional regulator with XRE-family HTH domain